MRNLFLGLMLVLAGAQMASAEEFGNGDEKAGAALYQQQCQVCHGVAGASIVPTQPILAAQHAHYLANELRKYKSGVRKNAVMSAQAANLSEADMDNIAHYLSKQAPVIAGADPAADMSIGEELYKHGDLARGVPACNACHGIIGEGIMPHFPRISGQHAPYVELSLRAFASGGRESKEMGLIASKLTEAEIKSLAAYISGLTR